MNTQPQPQPTSLPSEKLIRTYKSGFGGTADKKFVIDAAKLAKEGWRVQITTPATRAFTGQQASILVVYMR